MRVFYAEANYGDEEIKAAIKVLKEDRLALMCGKNVSELESRVAKIFRKDFSFYLLTLVGKHPAKIISPSNKYIYFLLISLIFILVIFD